MQFCFHIEQFGRFLFGEFEDGDTRPNTENVGDCFFVDFVKQVNALGFDVGLFLRALL